MNVPLTIFVDSDAFVAFFKNNDSNHKKAVTLFQKLKSQSAIFFTSNYVFSESITVISQRVGHSQAGTYIDSMKNTDGGFIIKRVDDEIEESAIEIFKKQTSKNTSFVDCTNMALLKKFSCDAIFSFDEVYRKNGFLLVEDLVANVS